MKRRPAALISRRNWRDTRAFLTYQDEVMHAVTGSLRLYRSAVDHLLKWATDIPFARAADLRPTYPRYVAEVGHLTNSYQCKLLAIARNFFEWADERYPEAYPGRVYTDTLRAVNPQATMAPETRLYTLDDVLRLAATSVSNLTEERTRAAACFLFLTGMRVTAFVTLPLEAVSFDRFEVKQWPALGVKTKNRKAATTYMLQTEAVGPLLDVVRAWDTLVRQKLTAQAPWYALIERGEKFAEEQSPGEHRGQNLPRRLRAFCERAGVPYLSPHKFRHGHAVYALGMCTTMDEFKAVSQNLMHEQMGTTDARYSGMLQAQLSNRISALGAREQPDDAGQQIRALLREFLGELKR